MNTQFFTKTIPKHQNKFNWGAIVALAAAGLASFLSEQSNHSTGTNDRSAIRQKIELQNEVITKLQVDIAKLQQQLQDEQQNQQNK